MECVFVAQWLERWVSDQGNFAFGGSNPTCDDISEIHQITSKDLENNSQSPKSQKNTDLKTENYERGQDVTFATVKKTRPSMYEG